MLAAIAVAATAAVLAPTSRAAAATPVEPQAPTVIHVSSTADGGDGSLRAALDAVSGAPGAGIVELVAGASYTLRACDVGALRSSGRVRIEGHGATIHQTCRDRILDHSGGDVLELRDLTMTGGSSSSTGGAVQADDLFVSGSRFEDNHATNYGGAIWAGTVSIVDSRFANNDAGGGGGAVQADHLTARGSRFAHNRAATGGALRTSDLVLTLSTVEWNDAGSAAGFDTATARIEDSTVEGNHAARTAGGGRVATSLTMARSLVADNRADEGGGLALEGDATIDSSTFAGNAALSGGGGALLATAGTVAARWVTFADDGADRGPVIDGASTATFEPFASLLVGDSPFASLCAGVTVHSGGHNQATGTACGLPGPGDRDRRPRPALSALADHGGPTRTLLPDAGAPSIDAVRLLDGDCQGKDQRGHVRPGRGGCAVGAVDLTPPA
ncbi:MAG: OmpA/MotB domain protein [Acidimicrobiales bacterium]|nr:OmpA/MotB domain protein [Acidimicrobiales bacterium]